MNRKKVVYLISAVCFAAVAVLFALKATIWKDRTPKPIKHDPTPTIPAEIPEGSVLVWRRTAIYLRENNKDERCYAKMEYDDLGRCIRVIRYPENTAEEVVPTTIVYDAVTKHSFTTSQGINVDGLSYRTVTETDTRGYIIAKQQYQQLEHGGDMLLVSDNTWWVDSFGNRVSDSNRTYSPSDGSFSTETRTVYDEAKKERRTEIRTSWNGDWTLNRTIDLDDEGRIFRIWDYEDGEKVLRTKKTYDSEGRLATDSSYDPTGTLITRTEYEYVEEYSGEGSVYLYTRTVDKDGNYVSSSDSLYTADGTKMYEGRTEGDETITVANNVLDGENRVIRSDTEFGVYDYEYDDNGNLVKSSLYTLDGLTSVTEYVYSPMVLTEAQVAQAAEYCDPSTISH